MKKSLFFGIALGAAISPVFAGVPAVGYKDYAVSVVKSAENLERVKANYALVNKPLTSEKLCVLLPDNTVARLSFTKIDGTIAKDKIAQEKLVNDCPASDVFVDLSVAK